MFIYFSLRFSFITRKNSIVERLDYQIPVTQLKGTKGMEMYKQQSEIVMRHLPGISTSIKSIDMY